MSKNKRPIILVEDDPFPRILQVLLDPDVDEERRVSFAHLMEPEHPQFEVWCSRIQQLARRLYPAEVRMVSSQEELWANLHDASVVMVESLAITDKELDLAPNLKVVQKYGSITTNIDISACRAHKVKVLKLVRRVNIACAEHALALMFSLAKTLPKIAGLISTEQLVSAGYSPASIDNAHTPTSAWAGIVGLSMLAGTTLGILGMGEIGRLLAPRAAALGMRVIYYQRTQLNSYQERHCKVQYARLDELLASSDWVSIHLPETPETLGFIGSAELTCLKRGARLINVSRARIVDRNALISALRSGHLGGFGLDVLYEEPGSSDDELLSLDNVILTPHIAGQFRTNSIADYEDLVCGLARALKA
jgi:phosphoglycerate dehydrogenase-like enzyme